MSHTKISNQEVFQSIGRAMRLNRGTFGPIADELPSVIPIMSDKDKLLIKETIECMVKL